jgi:GTP-binding protein EngB required for normal cell division
VIETQHARQVAKDLIDLLDAPAIRDNEQNRTFLDDQKGALLRALDESDTPEIYKVAVVGSFKVGKSSFVNALCGIKGLASVNSNPETAAITEFRYAEIPRAEAHLIRKETWEEMKRSHEEDPKDVRAARYHRLKELERADNSDVCVADLERDLISESGAVQEFTCPGWEDKKERRAFLNRLERYVSRRDPLHYFVDHLIIHVPVLFLKDGIELIDTPGLDDTDRYRVVLTEEYVKDVDAILFLTRSGNSYSQSDKDFIIRQLRRKTIKHLRVVVTKCDETFENAKQDALDKDEEAPGFEQHLDLERRRVRTELDRTLEELLAATDIPEDSRDYFREQLADIPINFISSRYHMDGHSEQSGINGLHAELMAMLRKGERVSKARKVLADALDRVCDRTVRVLKARRNAANQEFNVERVRHQLRQIEARVNGSSAGFERKVKREVSLLKDSNEKDDELVDAKIDSILLRCDAVVDVYCMADVGRHWRTRRCGNWGSLYQIQQRVADTIFPQVELLLHRFVQRFEAAVRRIQGQIVLLQANLLAVEQEVRLDGGIDPLTLSQTFGGSCQGFIGGVGQLVSAQRDEIVRHLESFVSDEVSEDLEQARTRVRYIYGSGTTSMQSVEVRSFYRRLKEALRGSLDSHLRGQIERFVQILLNRADSIYPEIKQELGLVIEDRLRAIESSLSELNDQQKATLVETLQKTIKLCDKIRKKIKPPTSPDHSE